MSIIFKNLSNGKFQNYRELLDKNEAIEFGKNNSLLGIDEKFINLDHGKSYKSEYSERLESVSNQHYLLGYKYSIEENEYNTENQRLNKEKEKLEKYYGQVAIVEAFHLYSGNSRLINGPLRKKESMIDTYHDAFCIMHKTLQNYNINENIIVYRVFKSDEWGIDAYSDFKKHIGEEIIDFGFLGTSLIELEYSKKDLQREFNTFLKIYVPKGAKGVYIEELSRRQEYEVLFQTNSVLKVLSVKKERNKIRIEQGIKYYVECQMML